jgi:phage terminase large subunit-like protein
MFWEENSEPKLTLESLLKRCEVVTVGIDGGGLDDMLGLSAIGREVKTGLWLHWAHAWIHPIVLERRKKEAARFRDFEKDGDLTIVEKIGDDLTGVAERIQQIEAAGLLERVGVDVAGIGGVVDALVSPAPKGIGLKQERIVGIPQGWKMVGAIKTTERKLAENMLKHAGSNLMAWCVGNAKVEPRGNAIVITKQLAGSAKIDPLMATFNAATLMALNPSPVKKKYQVMWI